jgi:hypothetical protein
MKAERFRRTKQVMASSAIALVVAALTFGVSSAVLRPASSPFAAPSGAAFTISSAIYASPACSGSTVLLYPGVTDCAVLSVHNNLNVPITVQSLSTTIASPPAGCGASNFSLPSFSGTMSVPANETVSTSGLPISLIDIGNQDACKGVTVNFTYTGNAQYTDTTSTSLAATPLLPVLGQPVSLTATVTASNPSTDPNGPTGTVTFYVCPTSACASRTALGTAAVGSDGKATLSTLSLLLGTNHVEAVYGGSGTDFSGSTSNVLALPIVAVITAPSNVTNGLNTTPGKNSSTSPAVAFTGADIAGMVAGGLALIGVGSILVLAVRRRRRTVRS